MKKVQQALPEDGLVSALSLEEFSAPIKSPILTENGRKTRKVGRTEEFLKFPYNWNHRLDN